MSHRLHTFASLSASRLILVLMIVLGVALSTETTLRTLTGSQSENPERAENTETLVIDLGKRLPTNPYQQEYEKMLYPTVRIKAGFSTGSGVVIGDYIISAAHVVGDYSEVQIEIYGTSTDTLCLRGFVAITDTAKDLALLTTDKHRLTQVYKATLAPQDYKPYLFTPVWAVGCSLGLPPRPSYGHITYIDSSVSIRGYEISAPILPGNSGGPVFDAKTYELIGIAVWVHTYKNQIVTTMAGVVPINQIYEFLNSHRLHRLTSASSAANESGAIRAPWRFGARGYGYGIR